jgi:hypothetical protein
VLLLELADVFLGLGTEGSGFIKGTRFVLRLAKSLKIACTRAVAALAGGRVNADHLQAGRQVTPRGRASHSLAHFDGYPAVLVRLDRIAGPEVEELLVEARLTRSGWRAGCSVAST